MTTVTNTVQNEVGAPESGAPVQIVLLAADKTTVMSVAFIGDVEISPNENTVTDADGKWTLNLYANDLITPAGTVYRVTHLVPSNPTGPVLFSVPADGATPVVHFLRDLLVS